jgi:hypothetical protein
MELLKSLRRRWILTVSLFVLTLAATGAALVKLPWTYQSQSAVVILASPNMAKSYGGNPYLAFTSALNQAADVVRYQVMDLRTSLDLAARGYPSSYLVADAVDTAGPVLVVTVTGHRPGDVEHTLQGVTDEISTKLSEQQAGISTSNRMRDLVITFSPKASRMASKKARPLTVVVGLGLVLTLAIPLIVDAALVRRRTPDEDEWQPDDETAAWDNARRSPGRFTDPDERSARYPVGASNLADPRDAPGRSEVGDRGSGQDVPTAQRRRP